ncbi:zinc-binding dehydrogenase [Spirillospora sp. NPDC127200]
MREDGAGLRELSELVDQGALRPRVDSTFHVEAVQAAHERFAQEGLRGKVTMTF